MDRIGEPLEMWVSGPHLEEALDAWNFQNSCSECACMPSWTSVGLLVFLRQRVANLAHAGRFVMMIDYNA